MDASKFIQNVKFYCSQKRIAPTAACRESGAGERLLENVKRGSEPSVGKVQLLAQYLGVTVSELLGECQDLTRSALPTGDGELLRAYHAATPDARLIVDTVLKPYK